MLLVIDNQLQLLYGRKLDHLLDRPHPGQLPAALLLLAQRQGLCAPGLARACPAMP